MAKRKIILVLWNLRSVENTASLFRTADAAGVEKIYLAGITSKPTDRFGKWDSRFIKISLGAERTMLWEYVSSKKRTLDALHDAGYALYALEQSPRSVSYHKVKMTHKKIALVLGNEVTGLPGSLLKCADKILEIPMHGHKESLNVAVAGGIALFRLRYQ